MKCTQYFIYAPGLFDFPNNCGSQIIIDRGKGVLLKLPFKVKDEKEIGERINSLNKAAFEVRYD